MQTLRICDIGLSPDPSHAFHSMLKVVDGRSIAAWHSSDVSQADVLIAHAGGDRETLDAWSATGKPVVLVVDDRGSWPPTQFVLRYPFRVMQLLAVLDDVAEHLGAVQGKAVDHGSGWATAESLRRLVLHTGESGWHVAQADNACRVWIGNGRAHALPDTIAQLRDGRLALAPFLPANEGPPPSAVSLPICDVAWFIGLSSPPGVAPWLSDTTAYRLRRWPDFGRLGAISNMIELSALTASHVCTPAALVQLSQHAQADVHRFLAAASLAGLLMVPARSESAVPAREQPNRGWMRFVGNLCRQLRLAS